jgi:hypothetical protein
MESILENIYIKNEMKNIKKEEVVIRRSYKMCKTGWRNTVF